MRSLSVFVHIGIAAVSVRGKVDESKFEESDIIFRDVAIIGGGGSGAHAAVLLKQDHGKSVVVIEKQDRLGGHVDTYYDKEFDTIQDYGVQAYFPYANSMDFFDRFENITLTSLNRSVTTTKYVDFGTGQVLVNFTAVDRGSGSPGIAAVQKFHDLCEEKGYGNMTTPGYWNLPPGPDIPDDLLLSLGEFVKKYEIEAMLPIVYPSTGGGVGSRGPFLDLLMFTFLKAFPPAWAKAMLGTVPTKAVEGGNQLLYNAIGRELGDENVLYKSVVLDVERSDGSVKVMVGTATGQKLIKAKRLLVAIQATRENLEPFDLDEQETVHFSKPKYGRSNIGIITHSKLENGVTYRHVPTGATPLAPFAVPPFVMSLGNLPPTNLFRVGASGPWETFDTVAAQAMVQVVIEKMAAQRTIPNTAGEKLVAVAWEEHGASGFGVSAEDMRAGFMEDMYKMQGKKSTWWTGEGVAADFSTILWAFNEDLTKRMVEDM